MISFNFKGLSKYLKPLLIFLWLLFFGLLVTLALVLRWYNSNLKPVDRNRQEEQSFIVVKGMTWDEAAAKLEEKGLIRDAAALRWHIRLNNVSNLQAGTFKLSPSDYAGEIVEILSSGLPSNVEVTVRPARSLFQLRQDLIEQGFKAIDVDTALQIENYADHDLVRNVIPRGSTLEGYIAPETFAVDQLNLDSAQSVIRRSLDTFSNQLTPEIRAGIRENFDSIHEGIIVASIVEKEVDQPQYSDKVAQVFIERYRQGQRLGSDVTFIYVADKENRPPRVDDPSPYNTRLHAGLPPGPISNVSRVSLQAVAFPAETDYLFFLVGDDGTMYFNRTYEGHLADREKYCIEACRLPGPSEEN